MKPSTSSFFFFICFLQLFFIGCKNEENPSIILTNLNIVNIKTGEIVEHQNVWIQGEHIIKIESSDNTLDAKLTSIDCSGKFLIPALWDMHTHTQSFDWGPKLLIANGVLGIREADGTDILPFLHQRKNKVFKGIEFYSAGNLIRGPDGYEGDTTVVTNALEAREEVRRQKALGFDFLKTHLSLSREAFFALVDESKKMDIPVMSHLTLTVGHDEAIKAGVASIEHTIALQEALQHKMDFINRIQQRDSAFFEDYGFNVPKYYDAFLKDLDTNLLDKIPELTGNGNTWFCPTLTMWRGWTKGDSISHHPSKDIYLPDEELEVWYKPFENDAIAEGVIPEKEYSDIPTKLFQQILKVLKPMKEQGTKFLAGTDCGIPFIYPGFDLHDELQLFVSAGFTPLEALQTATINPVLFLHREDELGTIETGKIANLVLLDKNPLVNIENTELINMVIQHGDVYNRERIDAILTSIKPIQQ